MAKGMRATLFKPLPDGASRRGERVEHNSVVFVMLFASTSVNVKYLSRDSHVSFSSFLSNLHLVFSFFFTG